ncbi:MAG: SDR family oxidoreductase [Pyrinomonadaceae bacterium]|nr:SDR family oxidoreductase [Acidobacteriota bacterium]MBK7935547.1 SDR family oxidoreductase [Acidobacteriota bacterium]MBP7377878.1 SDR family oxidoreductase [Pyrinomonadaceae bacterium]
MKTVLVFGGNGMLGHKLVQELGRQFDVFGTIRGGFETIEKYGIFDQTKMIENVSAQDIASIEAAVQTAQPDVVINSVGIIKQVPSAKDVITTLEINSIFPHRLAELSEKYGFRLFTISTDCVFDGIKGFYNESNVPNATDLYGKSKNLGEVTGPNCLTIRSSIIGRELDSSHSLIEWFLANRGKSVKGFTNAIYSGFPTIVFADIIASLINDHQELSGLYHIAAEPINKFDLLTLVNKYYDAGVTLERDEDFRIDRSLDGSRFAALTGFEPQSWKEMIRLMAADPTPYDSFRNK